jgi:hypothetical protein
MKKFYTLALILFASASFAQAFDVFSAAAGSNLADNGWAITGGALVGPSTTATGSLTYPGLTSTGNKAVIFAAGVQDVNLASAAPILAAEGAAYYSALINVLDMTGLAANTDAVGNYFLFMGSGAGVGTLAGQFNVRLYIRAGSVANTFNLGTLNNSGAPVTVSYAATNYPIATTLFVVLKFAFATNTSSLFVNPTIGGTEGTALISNATGVTAAPASMGSIGIRQSAATATVGGTGNIEIDEVRIGATWAYVTAAIVLKLDQNAIMGLSVYPNPVTNGNLFITSNSSDSKAVAIYDILGKQVIKANTSNNAVNVSQLKSGVYMLKITENEKTATRKLLIE